MLPKQHLQHLEFFVTYKSKHNRNNISENFWVSLQCGMDGWLACAGEKYEVLNSLEPWKRANWRKKEQKAEKYQFLKKIKRPKVPRNMSQLPNEWWKKYYWIMDGWMASASASKNFSIKNFASYKFDSITIVYWVDNFLSTNVT